MMYVLHYHKNPKLQLVALNKKKKETSYLRTMVIPRYFESSLQPINLLSYNEFKESMGLFSLRGMIILQQNYLD